MKSSSGKISPFGGLKAAALFASGLGLGFGSGAAGAQPVTPNALLQPFYDFETEAAPWVALGDGATLSLSHGDDEFKNGRGALRFSYGVRAGQFTLMALPTPLHGLDDTRSISFWIKSDYEATLTAVFNESGGGRYAAMFYAPAQKWQRVELSPTDFLLLTGAGNPPDADGKLDLGQVEAFALADLSQIYAGTADPMLATLLGLKTGPHTFFVDDVCFGHEALAVPAAPETPTFAATEKAIPIENLPHPQLAWSPLGGAKLSIEVAAPALPERSLRLEYPRRRGAMSGLMRRLPTGMLAGATRLRFEATSDQATTIMLRLDESGGGRYNLPVHLDGGGFLNKIEVNLANFQAADDSRDGNNRLDMAEVHQIGLIDISGLIAPDTLTETGAENSIAIGNLRAGN